MGSGGAGNHAATGPGAAGAGQRPSNTLVSGVEAQGRHEDLGLAFVHRNRTGGRDLDGNHTVAPAAAGEKSSQKNRAEREWQNSQEVEPAIGPHDAQILN